MSSLQNGQNLAAYDGGGAESLPDVLGYATLDIDTHYFALPLAANALALSVQILTDGTVAGTFTIEACNEPKAGTGGVTDYNETASHWTPVNVAALGVASTVGTGWTATVLSLAKTAGVGGAMVNLLAPSSMRYRVKAVITTGGDVRVIAFGKD